MFSLSEQLQHPLRQVLFDHYRMDEQQCVEALITYLQLSNEQKQKIQQFAGQLVQGIRERRLAKKGLDSFMHEYDLSTEEGIILMCLAEALLRIPDKDNQDKLIRDKMTKADWSARLGKSDSLFVNAATWGLMITGKILGTQKTSASRLSSVFKKMLERSGEPVIRTAISQAMRILGKQFVMGRTIKEAAERAEKYEAQGYRFSYDMLGEAARTAKDAERYFNAYQEAITEIKKAARFQTVYENPGISVKLSALYPRYEFSKQHLAVPAITNKLLILAQQCREANIPLTVDAEEAERLDISLNIIENVFKHPSLGDWVGFGLAIQSYQKRAFYLLNWLIELAKTSNKRLMVRLIKGAYWDSEIKMSQEKGLEGYPVFTRKIATDISFLACARKILSHTDLLYPMFATHNAHSVASIFEMAGTYRDFEFQCLHGMGANLYDQIVPKDLMGHPCRVYAPVGSHEDLLPYLVRRLLENGANSSFVNRISDTHLPVNEIVADPVEKLRSYSQIPNPNIPLPRHIYNERLNSKGIDLTNIKELQRFHDYFLKQQEKTWQAKPTLASQAEGTAIYNPANRRQLLGWVQEAKLEDVNKALELATDYFSAWDQTSIESRAHLLENCADQLEQNYYELLTLLIREAGKTLPDAIAEVREAIDFCRYYARLALKVLAPQELKGYTGESNRLEYHGRGPILCISPWNFPLAIFTGQIMAALVCGNPVIAKPAEQTPLIAAFAIDLFHKAGVPKEALHLLPGSGERVGAALVQDLRTKGVLFTGSTETAQRIQLTLIERGGPIVPLVAETGGQNVMIVDSSALPEQVVHDVLVSAFYSAGQRCSALRVLYLQAEIADRVIEMIKGAMDEITVGDPQWLATDIGPVIDQDALNILQQHAQKMDQEAQLIHAIQLPAGLEQGSFFGPRVYEISSIEQLQREVFGPILHVVRFQMRHLDDVLESINKTGYGLTFGIHSRIDATIEAIIRKVHVGNVYVNRNMVGAVVGVQPFGGEGLSGTGPKAGGPNYLMRLATERTVCINTTASGGNASLMTMEESL